MSSNLEQKFDFLSLTLKINRALTSQHVTRIAQHFSLPASITEAGNLWPEMRMRGQFGENNVWELREFLIKLNAEDPTNYLVEIINEISYYHNRYRAWQRNDSIANPISAPNHGEPAIPLAPPSKTSHYELPNPAVPIDAELKGLCGIPGPIGSSPPISVLGPLGAGSSPQDAPAFAGPLVGGSVGVPYYNHKRQIESPTEEKDKECGLCMTNEKYVATQPCGCVCLCGSCALTYSEKTCIGCTKPVTHLQGLRLG